MKPTKPNGSADRMTARERSDLAQLIRQRERVLKQRAKQRSAELRSEFEQQLDARYYFDQQEVWAEAQQAVEREVERANERIAAQCRTLGIPKAFAPSIDCGWSPGGEQLAKQRRTELRRIADTQIEASEQQALAKIAELSLAAQTEVVVKGLESKAAKSFLEAMPSLDSLMPTLQMHDMRKLLLTPATKVHDEDRSGHTEDLHNL
jgi:hypothetical protein